MKSRNAFSIVELNTSRVRGASWTFPLMHYQLVPVSPFLNWIGGGEWGQRIIEILRFIEHLRDPGHGEKNLVGRKIILNRVDEPFMICFQELVGLWEIGRNAALLRLSVELISRRWPVDLPVYAFRDADYDRERYEHRRADGERGKNKAMTIRTTKLTPGSVDFVGH
jgi:hypothetical protein